MAGYMLNRLVETGNTVVVIEHNLDVIKNADWIIDFVPEGDDRGGEIMAEGNSQIEAAQYWTGAERSRGIKIGGHQNESTVKSRQRVERETTRENWMMQSNRPS